MRHEDILKYVMSVVHRLDAPRADVSIYSVLNRNIIEVVIKMEYLQEERDTTFVESYNQQHIFIWFRNHINLPLVQVRGYTEREIHQAYKIIILDKSRYSDIIGKFGVRKSTLTVSLNVNFPRLKCSSLKLLWNLMGIGKITKKIVR